MAESIDVARYLVRLAADEAEPEYLSHMRLQKLLYYVQGWSVAMLGKPMFDSPIEAWTHGPVVRGVYPCFADYGSQPIAPHEASSDRLDAQEREFIRAVWLGYRQHSAVELRRMTHQERPWLEARGDAPPDALLDVEIPLDAMRAFLRQDLVQQPLPLDAYSI